MEDTYNVEFVRLRLTHSKSGLPCTATLPRHDPMDGEGFNGPASCSSHAEHVGRGLPHVCCCGFVVLLNDSTGS